MWCEGWAWGGVGRRWTKGTPPAGAGGVLLSLQETWLGLIHVLSCFFGPAGDYRRPLTDAVVVGRIVDGAHAVDNLRAGIKAGCG